MRVIELDGANWKTALDFMDALLDALGAPEWHGRSVGALTESMIWGEINRINPPYRVVICNVAHAPKDVRDILALVKEALEEARVDYKQRREEDVIVEFSHD